MKKLLFVALAAVGMAACVQNEELAVVKSDAIAFDNLYVNNATKADPSLTLAKLENFQVWGWMGSENGTVFTGDEVRKSGSAWIYDNTQYWVPEKNYYFEAVAPANGNWEPLTSTDANLTGVKFTNVSGEEDLLYAEYSVTTPNKATLANGVEKVKLQFGHLLSKVQFSFKNGFTTDNVTVKVTGVEMTAPAKATVALNEKAWSNYEDTVTLAFGDVESILVANANSYTAAADQRLTIPTDANQVYTVTFNVAVYYGTQDTPAFSESLTSTISGYALEVGKAYNFTAVVGPEVFDMKPIEFTVVGVDEWDQPDDASPVGKYVSSRQELQDAVDAAVNGDVICLGNNIEGDIFIVQKENVKLTIDGNGHKYNGQMKIHGNSNYRQGCATIIRDVNFETSTADVNFVYASEFGTGLRYSQNITVENCTFTAVAGSAAEKTVVGVQAKSSKNLVVKNCTATNAHSLLQAQSCDEAVLVDGCEAVNCKNGVSFGNTARPTLKNSTIVAAEYGVRADGNASRGDLVVEGTAITAKQPIIVRKVTTNGYRVALGQGVVLTTDELYQVIFTKGSDDVVYVKPEVEYNFSSVDNFSVYPPSITPITPTENGATAPVEGVGILEVVPVTDANGNVVKDENGNDVVKVVYGVTNAEGFAWVANNLNTDIAKYEPTRKVKTATEQETTPKYVINGNTIKLLADIDLTGVTTNGDSFSPIGLYCSGQGVNKPFTGHFDGNGHTIKGIYQSGWDFGYEWGTTGYLGLFGYVVDATIENLTIEGLVAEVEGGTLAAVAGRADGKCVFKNITVKNCKLGTYNNRCGAIVGWTGYYKNEADETVCDFTFEDINICDDVVLGGLWGSFDSSIGGVMGQLNSGATNCLLKNVTVSCRIDAYNDCTASYDYYLYRMCGMLIGQMSKTTTIEGSTYPDVAAYGIEFDNVTVNYGKWMNYHYCEPTPGLNGGRGMRVEPGFAYGGLPADFDHTQCVDNHYNCIPFDQLFGGTQTACKGVKAWEGVTVNYPAEYTCTLCGQQHNVK